MSESESKPLFTADRLSFLLMLGLIAWGLFEIWTASSAVMQEPDINDLKITYHPNAEGLISLENCELGHVYLKCTVAPTEKAYGFSRSTPVAVPSYAFKATSFDAGGIKVNEKTFPDMDIEFGQKVRVVVAYIDNETTSIEIMR